MAYTGMTGTDADVMCVRQLRQSLTHMTKIKDGLGTSSMELENPVPLPIVGVRSFHEGARVLNDQPTTNMGYGLGTRGILARFQPAECDSRMVHQTMLV